MANFFDKLSKPQKLGKKKTLLPMYDRHLGYIKKFLKKHCGQTG
jgi:hypothetical protein